MNEQELSKNAPDILREAAICAIREYIRTFTYSSCRPTSMCEMRMWVEREFKNISKSSDETRCIHFRCVMSIVSLSDSVTRGTLRVMNVRVGRVR